ncbi:ABC transporter substrate-binding protein [Catenulispora subtropica]|uniref:ABC transporter substrate-binding protein n=1 Tax=Catenulispora subtropica TaxID=450798 RepID=A0ABP5C2S4_9ACTN
MARLSAAVACLALLASCSDGPATTPPGAFIPPPIPMVEPGAQGEGEVNLVVWAGYAEKSWTDPFTKTTGCKVNAMVAGSSDEMVADVKSGQYDVVSASGDASLRLIASGDVAPIDVGKVPSYAQIYPSLKNKSWNSVAGVPYGVPHGRGANVLVYNKDKVKSPPTSLGAVFDPDPTVAGHVTVYDSPISIADAALYLMHDQPGLGIKNPYALDRPQFDAAVALLTKQQPAVGSYWSDTAAQQADFEKGGDLIGTSWQVVLNGLAHDNHKEITSIKPVEGVTGWSDTWMIAAGAKNPTCAYKWLDYITSPAVNAKVAEFFGEAPANSQACAKTTDPGFCATYHADEEAYWDNVWYWTTPTTRCLDGSDRTCVPYSEWVTAWNRIKQK